jgi:hypothetical protein
MQHGQVVIIAGQPVLLEHSDRHHFIATLEPQDRTLGKIVEVGGGRWRIAGDKTHAKYGSRTDALKALIEPDARFRGVLEAKHA